MVKTTRLKNSCTKATLKQTIAELTNDKIVADKLIYKMNQTIVQMTLMTEMDRKHASVREMDAFVRKTKDEEMEMQWKAANGVERCKWIEARVCALKMEWKAANANAANAKAKLKNAKAELKEVNAKAKFAKAEESPAVTVSCKQ
jgi:hypothetical protein